MNEPTVRGHAWSETSLEPCPSKLETRSNDLRQCPSEGALIQLLEIQLPRLDLGREPIEVVAALFRDESVWFGRRHLNVNAKLAGF